MTKEDLIVRLVEDHNKTVQEIVRTNGHNFQRAVPDSLHNYTCAFMKNLLIIVKDMK